MNFGKRLQRDKRSRTDKGCYPSITLNNNGTIVEVNHQTGTNLMFYRVGQKKGNTLEWASPSSTQTPKKHYYGSGAYPRVSLNDKDLLVEVHKGQFMDRCFYRIGKVNYSTRKINWGASTYFNAGLRPDVAINNANTAVVAYQDNVFMKQLYYRVGQVSKAGNEICWVSKQRQKICLGKHRDNTRAESHSLDINENGLVVLAYQTPLNNHIHYRVGIVNLLVGSIEWTKTVHKCIGFTPSISINNNDQVLQIHQSLTQRHLVSNVGVARWSDTFRGIDWSSKNAVGVHYGKGIYPSVALNERGEVVEVHEPRVAPNRNRLHYYVGNLVKH